MKMQIKKPQTALSLTATLALAFLTLSAVVLLISSGLQLFSNFQAQQETIASQQQLIAQDATKAVSSFIQEKFSVLETAARLSNPATASIYVPQEQKQLLDSLLGLQPAFRQLVLLNGQDRELVRTSRLSQAAAGGLADQLKGDLLGQLQQRQRYISPVYFDAVTSEPLVIIAVPMVTVLGEFEGTLVAEVNLKFMWDLVDQLQVGETGRAYVVDRQGRLIAFSDTARVLKGENVGQLKPVADFIQNPVAVPVTGVSIYSGITGATVVGTYNPLGTPDWAVVTELPWQEAYQEVIWQGVWSIGITLAMAVLAGLLGVYMARRLAVPLVNLMDTASRITGGEMELQAGVAGPSEVASLARAFNSMTGQLRQILAGLEERVADRTQQLEIVAAISERLNAILDPGELLREVVNQVKEKFGYYHAHIYLLDEPQERLVVAEGTGPAGAEMKAKGHSISFNAKTSLVARAAQMGQIVRVNNVREAEDWLPNPLLPDTYAEMAVPIVLEGQVVGVLDVQEDEIGGLDEGDASLLRSLANQVAIAIRNARLFDEVETALAEARSVQERYVGQAWDRTKVARLNANRVQFSLGESMTLDETIIAEARRQAFNQRQPTLVALNGQLTDQPGREALDPQTQHQQYALVAPINLHGVNTGHLQLHEIDPERTWTEGELALINAVVDQVAQTAESLRLLDEIQERASREQLISQISAQLRRAPDMETLMKIGVAELVRVLGPARTFIRLGSAAELGAAPVKAVEHAAQDSPKELTEQASELS